MSDASKELLNHAKQRFSQAFELLETQVSHSFAKSQNTQSVIDDVNISISEYINTLDSIIEKQD